MNILLVEPNYKNKYPPIGLMKISTYHKNRGDRVFFFKGKLSSEIFTSLDINRIYITTLFTFYYATTIDTIRYYQELTKQDNIFIGGILATLMYDKLNEDLEGQFPIIKRQLTSSCMLGFNDDINIDCLPLDYSILDDVDYDYPSGDNYFAYVSRGCCNKCEFCAVPTLEPMLFLTNGLTNQINNIDKLYGKKQNLLLMDNNILSFNLEQLSNIVEDIYNLGFDKREKYIAELPFDIYMRKINNSKDNPLAFELILKKLVNYLNEKVNTKKSKIYNDKYNEIVTKVNQNEDKYGIIYMYRDILNEILSAYFKPKGRKKSVDFNQGIDARILCRSEEKMKILSKIPIAPFRLAFDNLKYREDYEAALRLAYKYGVNDFSNYLLYNFDDEPEQLWYRLKINIDLANELDIKIFSFPMKYAPITKTDRLYVGKFWNKKYLSNIHAILNVTKGIVAKGESFFYRAYGRTIEEYFKILSMPRDFVTYRNYFENIGLTSKWEEHYYMLNHDDKLELIEVLSSDQTSDNTKIRNILPFYSIKYESFIKENK